MTTPSETCATCKFCRLSSLPARCQRQPPVVIQGQINVLHQWPAVEPTDWCGDWEAKT